MARQKAAPKPRERRGFGRIEQRGSGRWRAAYTGPDKRLYRAPDTFAAKVDAEGWLAQEKRLIDLGSWQPPILREVQEKAEARQGATTFREYAATWAAHRNVKPRTRAGYRGLLERKILPTFGEMPVAAITPYAVKEWYTAMGTGTPTLRAHAYSLLRTILGEAVRDGEIAANPCHIRGAGNSKRVHKIKPASLPELEAITEAMPERYRLMVLLAAWCGLRFGELSELRRSDMDTTKGVIRVRRAVVRVDPISMPDPLPPGIEFCGCRPGCLIGPPKSDAGTRDVALPPHLIPMVKDHLSSNITGGRDGLLFPASDGEPPVSVVVVQGVLPRSCKGWST